MQVFFVPMALIEVIGDLLTVRIAAVQQLDPAIIDEQVARDAATAELELRPLDFACQLRPHPPGERNALHRQTRYRHLPSMIGYRIFGIPVASSLSFPGDWNDSACSDDATTVVVDDLPPWSGRAAPGWSGINDGETIRGHPLR